MMWSIISGPYISSVEKSPDSFKIRLFCFFFFLMFSHMSSVCILEISPLSDIQFANILSRSVGCLFILLMVSFAVQELFCLL